jgi:hypothetical protein
MSILTRLRAADPVTWLRDETDAYAPPPRHVMERIVASTPPPPPRGHWRRRLVIAAAAASFIAAAALGLLQVLPSDKDVDLAAKAYAATTPGDSVVYSRLTLETMTTPGLHDRTSQEIWQYRDRAHRIETTVELRGKRAGQTWRYEYETRGDRTRALYPTGKVDTWRAGAIERQTIVERFRTRYADAQLRDAGETIFAGRRAHAYRVVGRPAPRPKTRPMLVPDRETFYLDPESSLPLGSVGEFYGGGGGLAPSTDPPTGKPVVALRTTEVVEHFERLPPTPENLAKLDAPAIDAADSEPLSRPRRKGNPKG